MIHLFRMCHLGEEPIALEAGFSGKPVCKTNAKGFHVFSFFFFFFFLSPRYGLLHVRNSFLNARPENLSWALLVIHASSPLLPSSCVITSLKIMLPKIQPCYRAVAFGRQPAMAGSMWSV